MSRQRITVWAVVSVLICGGVAEAGMTVGDWGYPGWGNAGAIGGPLSSGMLVWKSDLGKTYRSSGATVFAKAVDFHFSGLLGGGNLSHRIPDVTGFDLPLSVQDRTWDVRVDRSRFVVGRYSSVWSVSLGNGCRPVRCWGEYEWLRDCTKDKDESPCGPTPTVPAPGAIALAGIGTVAVGWLRRLRSL